MHELEELISKYKTIQNDNHLDILWYLTSVKILIDDLIKNIKLNDTLNYLSFIIESEIKGFGTDIGDTLMTCYDVLIQIKNELNGG